MVSLGLVYSDNTPGWPTLTSDARSHVNEQS